MFRKRHPPPGASPGAMVIPTGALPPRLYVMDYSADRVDERDITDVKALENYRGTGTVSWIDVQGLGDRNVLEHVAELFSLHRLALADIVNVPQRPKVEAYDANILIIVRMVSMLRPPDLEIEQLSIVLGPGHVLTFQERYGDVFDPVRERIRQGGTTRRSGPDYLAYAIIDAVVDGYYPILESLGEHLEDIENDIMAKPRPATMRQIHFLKRELLALRRGIWPQREAVNALIRDEQALISEPVRFHLRDCYDHAVQVTEVVETYRELAGDLTDMYLSSVSNRMNQVMKLLTVMASIFIPLTFIVGIYGMNFDYMPELHTRWGYPLVWLVMLATAVGLLIYFRQRGWLSSSEDDEEKPEERERRP